MNGNCNWLSSRVPRLTLMILAAAATGGAIAAEEMGVVTIVAERASKQTVGRSPRGVPVEQISITQHVSYADLDLATAAGAAALEKRVQTKADEICKKLDSFYPVVGAGTSDCAKQAVNDAMPSLHAAIAAAEKSKTGGVTNK